MSLPSHRPVARPLFARAGLATLGLPIVLSTLAGCHLADTAPLADLPSANGATMRAVLVLHDQDCDGNLASFGVFDRDDVRRALPLVGVVPLDAAADTARIRRSLTAYDLDVPVLAVRRTTRDSLRATAHDQGMTVLVVRRGRVALALAPPQGPDGLVQFKRTILALAEDSSTPPR